MRLIPRPRQSGVIQEIQPAGPSWSDLSNPVWTFLGWRELPIGRGFPQVQHGLQHQVYYVDHSMSYLLVVGAS